MRMLIAAATVAVLTVAGTGIALAGDEGRPRHVTHITGTRGHGFHVVWSDGDQWWTPTLSEELAECTAYDRPFRRGRCKASSRTRHHWMGIVKRSLRNR
ncbi:MAG: hypothetical protein ACRDOJ_14290 [Nocardioidaceae bacterium]